MPFLISVKTTQNNKNGRRTKTEIHRVITEKQ
ncbi:hypothetical protein QF044_003658 [Chryseobacterium sp. W4I1]|nr:hypothetical protein [Chryseobacterium sp. W4I1]